MIVESAIRQDGKVYTGRRHPNIIHHMVQDCNITPPVRGEQGFVDDNGTFLDRKEAAQHAIDCGQIAALKWPPNLYSEDLY
jgi:hypothetical protein